jgi:hypothetical protein
MGPTESKVRDKAPQARKSSPEWEIRLDTWPRKLIAITLVVVACGALIYRTWWLFLAAWITRGNPPDPAIYERAIRYDPQNADYRFVLAQLYNYSTEHLNIPRAGEEYLEAVRLNPYRSAHWLELSKYYEQAGDKEQSVAAMKRALQHDPNYAQTHWAAANLYIRLNDLSAADFELRRTADLDVSYLSQVLDLVWQFYQDPVRIMATHVPNTKESNLVAMNYFISQKSESGAALAWAKLRTFTTKPPERFGYVDYLVTIGKPHEAWKVFTYPATESTPIVFNPSFETDPINGGFDWRYASTDDAEARRDTTTAKTGMASWLVNFAGKENIDYAGVWHWIPVTKGKSYKLSFWMKTEGISTNEGVFIEVDGRASEKQVGTTYWQQFEIPFTASGEIVTIRLRRVPTKKFDNLLKGKVWLDDFDLK